MRHLVTIAQAAAVVFFVAILAFRTYAEGAGGAGNGGVARIIGVPDKANARTPEQSEIHQAAREHFAALFKRPMVDLVVLESGEDICRVMACGPISDARMRNLVKYAITAKQQQQVNELRQSQNQHTAVLAGVAALSLVVSIVSLIMTVMKRPKKGG